MNKNLPISSNFCEGTPVPDHTNLFTGDQLALDVQAEQFDLIIEGCREGIGRSGRLPGSELLKNPKLLPGEFLAWRLDLKAPLEE